VRRAAKLGIENKRWRLTATKAPAPLHKVPHQPDAATRDRARKQGLSVNGPLRQRHPDTSVPANTLRRCAPRFLMTRLQVGRPVATTARDRAMLTTVRSDTALMPWVLRSIRRSRYKRLKNAGPSPSRRRAAWGGRELGRRRRNSRIRPDSKLASSGDAAHELWRRDEKGPMSAPLASELRAEFSSIRGTEKCAENSRRIDENVVKMPTGKSAWREGPSGSEKGRAETMGRGYHQQLTRVSQS